MAEVRGEVRPRAHPLAWSGRGREDVRPQQPQVMETGELEKVLQVTRAPLASAPGQNGQASDSFSI